jgi:hypothetical protein
MISLGSVPLEASDWWSSASMADQSRSGQVLTVERPHWALVGRRAGSGHREGNYSTSGGSRNDALMCSESAVAAARSAMSRCCSSCALSSTAS